MWNIAKHTDLFKEKIIIIMESLNLQDGGTRKDIRSGEFLESDECVLKLLKHAHDYIISLSGPIVCAKMKEFTD